MGPRIKKPELIPKADLIQLIQLRTMDWRPTVLANAADIAAELQYII